MKWVIIAAFVSVVLAYLIKAQEFLTVLVANVKSMAIIVSILGIILEGIDVYNRESGERELKPEEIKPGMILADEIADEMSGDFKKLDIAAMKVKPKLRDHQDVERVIEWAKQKQKSTIIVCQKFPFALWMYVGVLVTLFFQGSLLIKLLEHIR